MDSFVTIEEPIEAEIVEKKSRFIANLFPCGSIQEAEEQIKKSKKTYHDARHNCVAYRILEDERIVEKSNDDGEPSGTAGAPMLAILQKNNLVNILIIVTRYFGGTLLGTGGLVRAYSESLQQAIEKSKKITMCNGVEFFVSMDYGDFEIFKYYCKKNNIYISNVEYTEDVNCIIEFKLQQKATFVEDFENKKVILKKIEEKGRKLIRS